MKYLALLFLCGCAHLRSVTIKEVEGAPVERTEVQVWTFFDAQSALTKFRNTTGQTGNGSNVWSFPAGTTIGGLTESASSTNLNDLVSAIIQGVVAGAIKGAK